ncbi:hypothetical protein KUL42_30730 [Alteromonas sp. KUL42]|nr:hypothetical protein [Alteromonas sp. KUL42]GEA08312.1 hypothetical protein KUL42_30730 [Alteromonas sp. KUL42]
MADWINAIMFGVALIAFTLGLSSIIMGFITAKAGAEGMQEKTRVWLFWRYWPDTLLTDGLRISVRR